VSPKSLNEEAPAAFVLCPGAVASNNRCVHEDEVRMKKSFGPEGAIAVSVGLFIVLIVIMIMLPKRKDIPVFDPPVTHYASVYQDMYPSDVTILERQDDVKSYEIVFSTSATKDTVFDWYDARYAAHGWTHILLYSSPEEERLNRYWDYVIDRCRSLGLIVEYNQYQNTYSHIIILSEGRMCRRKL
jgi:hypothetical protein